MVWGGIWGCYGLAFGELTTVGDEDLRGIIEKPGEEIGGSVKEGGEDGD